ncbi:hypothetical protein JN531_012515 [Flagellatimonas centrodinii]|uniref:hypothetical protein n=1 Tax=Flagellatimonas centrodinii TaxID=2806210 RepID=UPI001FEF4DB2|nr:hypothetical protein [Flagellatimonas centrodinii]ULQ45922.1 hypothetical protein JN531_012515 [Flagellatimonas centrodinii]
MTETRATASGATAEDIVAAIRAGMEEHMRKTGSAPTRIHLGQSEVRALEAAATRPSYTIAPPQIAGVDIREVDAESCIVLVTENHLPAR